MDCGGRARQFWEEVRVSTPAPTIDRLDAVAPGGRVRAWKSTRLQLRQKPVELTECETEQVGNG
jgi:hypothetical protein